MTDDDMNYHSKMASIQSSNDQKALRKNEYNFGVDNSCQNISSYITNSGPLNQDTMSSTDSRTGAQRKFVLVILVEGHQMIIYTNLLSNQSINFRGKDFQRINIHYNRKTAPPPVGASFIDEKNLF